MIKHCEVGGLSLSVSVPSAAVIYLCSVCVPSTGDNWVSSPRAPMRLPSWENSATSSALGLV